jgi:hypothetical protein
MSARILSTLFRSLAEALSIVNRSLFGITSSLSTAVEIEAMSCLLLKATIFLSIQETMSMKNSIKRLGANH